MWRSRSFGYEAAEFATATFARTHIADGLSRGVIHSPGRGSTDLTLVTPPWSETTLIVTDIDRPGITFQSGTTWGNDVAIARIEALRSFFGTQYGAKVDKVHFVCGSMGALNALNYAQEYPTRVKSLVLQTPLTDLIAFHDANTGGWAGEIEAAYASEAGGWTGQKVEHSPQEHLAEIAALGIPMRVWASTDDPYVPFATAQAFATSVGAEFQSIGACGHNPLLYAPLNNEILTFLEAND